MGYRRFTDREGEVWEVRDASSSEWELVPVSGSGRRALRIRVPAYEADPFELSAEELQRLVDAAGGGGGPRRKSPFLD